MLRNIFEHANGHQALICGQYWANHTAKIAIIDEGVGIKESFQENMLHRPYTESDLEAIHYSLEAGIS